MESDSEDFKVEDSKLNEERLRNRVYLLEDTVIRYKREITKLHDSVDTLTKRVTDLEKNSGRAQKKAKDMDPAMKEDIKGKPTNIISSPK